MSTPRDNERLPQTVLDAIRRHAEQKSPLYEQGFAAGVEQASHDLAKMLRARAKMRPRMGLIAKIIGGLADQVAAYPTRALEGADAPAKTPYVVVLHETPIDRIYVVREESGAVEFRTNTATIPMTKQEWTRFVARIAHLRKTDG